MTITKEEIQRIANLAYIKIQKGDDKALVESTAKFIAHAESLSEIDTTDVTPMISVAENTLICGKGVTREDKVDRVSQSPEDVLSNAPKEQDNFFVVPKVIE